MSIILIGSDNLCFCNCGTRCVVDNRCGSTVRCSKELIEEAGYTTVCTDGKKSDREVENARTRGGTLGIKHKKHKT